MSNRYSILAIGVAALFMICAVSGALIIASDNNDSDTANDSNSSTRIRSYSSYSSDSSDADALKAIRPVIDFTEKQDSLDTGEKTASSEKEIKLGEDLIDL